MARIPNDLFIEPDDEFKPCCYRQYKSERCDPFIAIKVGKEGQYVTIYFANPEHLADSAIAMLNIANSFSAKGCDSRVKNISLAGGQVI